MDRVGVSEGEPVPTTPQWMALHRLRGIDRNEEEWSIRYAVHGEDDLHALYFYPRALLERYGKNPFEMTTWEVLANQIADARNKARPTEQADTEQGGV